MINPPGDVGWVRLVPIGYQSRTWLEVRRTPFSDRMRFLQ